MTSQLHPNELCAFIAHRDWAVYLAVEVDNLRNMCPAAGQRLSDTQNHLLSKTAMHGRFARSTCTDLT
eukprot:841257-Rhodomonas_salina.2